MPVVLVNLQFDIFVLHHLLDISMYLICYAVEVTLYPVLMVRADRNG
jgi:hypothetical protein